MTSPTDKIKSTAATEFNTIIINEQNDPKRIQQFCEKQRSDRNDKRKGQMLSKDFAGVRADQYLINALSDSNYSDPRNNISVWIRPTKEVVDLVELIQKELLSLAPNIWLMPPSKLHMTVLEIVHSKTPEVLAAKENDLRPFARELADFPVSHKCRLVKPKLSFDDAAVALSFVPAAGEGNLLNDSGDNYTYLHLRRDMIELCQKNGVMVEARYATTSSHITVARFISGQDHNVKEEGSEKGIPCSEKISTWISKLEGLNEKLEEAYWFQNEGLDNGIQWYVGQERGLDIRKGGLWYGDGESILVGQAY